MMSDLASICNACGGYGLRHERELEHELREARAEVERLNRHRDELSADRHRHLLEIRALDAEVERLRTALQDVTEYADDMNSYDAGRVARAALEGEHE